MLRIIKNTLSYLSGVEKKTLLALTIGNFIISLLDIASIAGLVYIIGIFSGQFRTGNTIFYEFLVQDKILLSVVFLLLFSLKNLAGFILFKRQFGFVYNVSTRMSRNNLYGYLNGGFTDYSNIDSSVHIRKISYQPIEFCHYVLAGLQQIATEIMLVTLAILAIIFYNPQLFLLLLLTLAPPVLFIVYFTKQKLKHAKENVKTASEKSLQHLQEALSGYVESNIYDKNSFFTHRYFIRQWQLNKYLSQIQSLQAAPVRLIETFAVFGLFLLIAANYYWQQTLVLNIINLGAFLAAAYKIIPGIVKIINLSGQVRTYQYTVQESATNPYITIEKNASVTNQTLQTIEFKNISFSQKSQPVLKDFNLKIEAGEFIGISGISGRGKTTIINLLLGFFIANDGEILINNKLVNTQELKLYWQNIALVKQRPFVMADSILHNITLDDKATDDQQLQQAISVAGLENMINQFPEGLNTLITENSKNISGGQQQRIVLARAIYKNADLLILDEPFCELDTDAEENILKSLQQLAAKGMMIILISHNKNSLAYCHKIVSLDA